MTENQWNREFKRRLTSSIRMPLLGAAWKVNDVVTPGVSDFILFLNGGKTAFIESKRVDWSESVFKPGYHDRVWNLLTAKQQEFLLNRAGQQFPCYVLLSVKSHPGGCLLYTVQPSGELSLIRDLRFGGWSETIREVIDYFNGIGEW